MRSVQVNVEFVKKPPGHIRFRHGTETNSTTTPISLKITVSGCNKNITNAIVVLSCVSIRDSDIVSKEVKYYAHPYRLENDENDSGDGFIRKYYSNITEAELFVDFNNVEIVRLTDAEPNYFLTNELLMRKKNKEIHFQNLEFPCLSGLKIIQGCIDAVRLCAQVYTEELNGQKLLCTRVSNPVFDKHVFERFKIAEVYPKNGLVLEESTMTILCYKNIGYEKDVKVSFCKESRGKETHIAFAHIEKIHEKRDIIIRIPPELSGYLQSSANNARKVYLRVERLFDGYKDFAPITFKFIHVNPQFSGLMPTEKGILQVNPPLTPHFAQVPVDDVPMQQPIALLDSEVDTSNPSWNSIDSFESSGEISQVKPMTEHFAQLSVDVSMQQPMVIDDTWASRLLDAIEELQSRLQVQNTFLEKSTQLSTQTEEDVASYPSSMIPACNSISFDKLPKNDTNTTDICPDSITPGTSNQH